MDYKIRYSQYFRPIEEHETKEWRPRAKSFTTELFEAFVESEHKMVEVDIEKLPNPIPKKTSKVKSTKQDSFASSFYAWKRRRRSHLRKLGVDVLLIRRGEKVALKKKSKSK